jgi:DNA-directed RNA polymerase subunit RPC12/RpoP
MKWDRIEREIVITHVPTGLLEPRKCVGWVCSTCGHTHWAERHPDGGCWQCGGRDTVVGKEAVQPRVDAPREVVKVGRTRLDDPPDATIACPACGVPVRLWERTTLLPHGGELEVSAQHLGIGCSEWQAGEIDTVALYREALALRPKGGVT